MRTSALRADPECASTFHCHNGMFSRTLHSGRFRVHPRNQGAGLGTSSRRALARRRFRPGPGPSTTWVPPDEPRLPCRARQRGALCALPCPVRSFERSIEDLPVRPTCGTLRLRNSLRVSLPVAPKDHFGDCRASRVSVRRRSHGHVGRGCDPSGVVAGRHGSPCAWSRCAPSSPSWRQRPTELSVAGPLADGSGTHRFRGAEPRSAPLQVERQPFPVWFRLHASLLASPSVSSSGLSWLSYSPSARLSPIAGSMSRHPPVTKQVTPHASNG